MQKMNSILRVRILPIETDISKIIVTKESKVIVPVIVDGYTLISELKNGRLIIGVAIHTKNELTDFSCSVLGYRSIEECLKALSVSDSQINNINVAYATAVSTPEEDMNWEITLKYLKSMFNDNNAV
ncbi:hypothetical protein NEPAR08_0804 [Nematocida parisii]|nr:hypothetical protein NEPAR08_0804 [Nematocida parisii]KAI5127296.1 hypothetical protein NEPAR03_0900 [Nematocida parisii]